MTSTMLQQPAPRRRLLTDRRVLDAALLTGLAGVFLVNAVVALLQPGDFLKIVERSVIGRTSDALAGDWMAWVIGVNDAAIGIGLVAAIWCRRARPAVLAWAGVWLLVVTVVKTTSLHALGG